MSDHICHQRILPATFEEIDELVIEVSRWLTGNPWEIPGTGGTSLIVMAGSTGENALRKRVRNLDLLRMGETSAF
jgi:hypothetical protein